MTRPTKITIDIAALKHNVTIVRKFAPQSKIMAMVKSNAYGHGIERIGKALSDVDALGVACSEEGMMLRNVGVKNPIVLMEGLFHADEINRAVEHDFTLVIHRDDQIAMLESYSGNKMLDVWLKIDTGMHRLGFAPAEFEKTYARLLQCLHVKKPIGLMTHFADSDSFDQSLTQNQMNLFNTLISNHTGPCSLANSGGIIAWPSSHADWIRPGLMLYGASPFAGKTGKDHGLKPVMNLTSELIAIHHLTKGDRVGYGGTWVCPEDMPIGVVGIGYGDGYPRHAKNGMPVLVDGVLCPLAGRVSMDMITIDLRAKPNATVGDPVLLWGHNLPVELIAKDSGTTAYELLTRITQRVHVDVTS